MPPFPHGGLKVCSGCIAKLVYWAPSFTEKNQHIWSKMAMGGGPKPHLFQVIQTYWKGI